MGACSVGAKEHTTILLEDTLHPISSDICLCWWLVLNNLVPPPIDDMNMTVGEDVSV